EFYVNQLSVLEKSFGFDKVIAGEAKKYIELLEDSQIVDDMQYITERSNDLAFAKKLVRASRHSPVFGDVSNENIINFSKKHRYLSKVMKLNHSEDAFVLKTKTSQDRFIKMMLDDYLVSELTNNDYESLAKNSLKTA
ncbi:MAG: DUF4868 domain-containing protein, partial [Oceanospirillaceae bacterium]|nr:DUF4868 domain-containing protein [Oceanospirillaceae bacterium]